MTTPIVYNICRNEGSEGVADKICMFTGHRTIDVSKLPELTRRLDELIETLINDGYNVFCAGGAVGFDTLAELKILEKKKKYNFIRLCLYLPCKGQEKKWSEGMKQIYFYVLAQADEINYSCEHYMAGCMQKRNREMADACDICVAYCGSDTGGSRYTVNYAIRNGKKVINLFDDTEEQLSLF